MTYQPKLKSSKSFKSQDGKFPQSSWAMALGDLVKRTKKNLEGVDSATSISSIVNDGKIELKKEKVFQKTNAYKLLGLGRSSSAFGSRNSTGNFIATKLNTNSIESIGSSKVQIAASFDDDSNINQCFKK